MLWDLLEMIGCMSPIWHYALNYVVALAFFITLPFIIRDLIRR